MAVGARARLQLCSALFSRKRPPQWEWGMQRACPLPRQERQRTTALRRAMRTKLSGEQC